MSFQGGDMDLELYRAMLLKESTSGTERELAEQLAVKLCENTGCHVKKMEVGDGTLNLLFSWGRPRVYFCTHLDTVPPYTPPVFESLDNGDVKITGRGSCDAKGQIFAMYSACRQLKHEGYTHFGLLLLAGEETGSFGAKAFTRQEDGGEWVIVGEPTCNKMVSASKGTKAFDITILGKSCHSGYPDRGVSAVERFVDFINELRSVVFPVDELMGATTYNVGKLESCNPQNVLSDRVHFRLYFRTTQASDDCVVKVLGDMASEHIIIKALGGDTPMSYLTLPGFDTTTVAFGSDAPRLSRFKHRSMCGPGSILVAHRDDECVLLSELEKARDQYVAMVKKFFSKTSPL